MKRRSKLLLLLLIVAAAFAIGFFLLPDNSHRRALEAYKQQLRAQGEKLSPAELARPGSPEGISNANAFMNAIAGFTFPTNPASHMKFIAPGVAVMGHSNMESSQMTNYAPNLAKTAELRAVLKPPVLDFNLNYALGYEIPLPPLARLKAAGQFMTTTASQALREGNYAAAWSNLTTAVDFVRLMPGEPLMISDLVRVAVAQIAVGTTWDALQENRWTDAELADLQARWEAVDFVDHLETVTAYERASGLDFFARARVASDLDALLLLNSGMSASPAGHGSFLADLADKIKELVGRYRFQQWKKSWSFDEELLYLQVMSNTITVVHRAQATRTFVPALKELQEQATGLDKQIRMTPNRYQVLPLISSPFISYFRKLASAQTTQRLLITAIALKRYQLQHHAYPADLNELVPAYLKQVPLDPWDGQPLRYRPRPDGTFLLYSVGEDGKDDGGDPTPTVAGTTINWMLGRDIVWPRAATPAEIELYNRSQKTNAGSSGK